MAKHSTNNTKAIRIALGILFLSILSFQSFAEESSSQDSLRFNQTIDSLLGKIGFDSEGSITKLLNLQDLINAYPYSPLAENSFNFKIDEGLMEANIRLGKTREAISFGERAIEYADNIGKYSEAQRIRAILGNLYLDLGEKSQAMNMLYKSLSSWDGELPLKSYPIAYSGIGKIHFGQRNFQDAVFAFEEAMKWNPDEKLKSEIFEYLGSISYENGEFLNSLEEFSKALALNEQLKDELKTGKNFRQIADVFHKLGRYNKSEEFLLLAMHHDSLANSAQELALVFSKLMDLYTEVGRPTDAFNYGKMALELERKHSDVKIEKELYLGLSELHKNKDEFHEAYTYLKKYNEEVQSSLALSASKENNEFRVKYEIEKKERDLEELRNQKRLSDLAFKQKIEDDKKEKSMLFAFGVLMFIIIILGAVILFNYQRQIEANKTITQKTEEINRVKIKELEKSLRLETVSAMLKGQEIERNRIAQDLHDSVGALLSSIKLHFESLKNKPGTDKNKALFEKTNQLIDDACFEVRSISHEMMPGSLMKFGLIPALRDYTTKLRLDKKLAVDLVDFGVPEKIDDTLSLNAYRIIQELLNNVIKHSKANEVLVQLTMKGSKLNIMVEDDGVGFDTEAASEKGIGLRNIISRVNYLNGEIHFDSKEGQGSNIMIDFPMAG